MATAVTGNLKQRLKGDNKDLYTHVQKVMSHIFRHQPPNSALDNLEEVSVLLKDE